MPSKKKKYNARFPAGRIKKIMQSDEDIGKVAQAVPVIISRTLELFVESLLTKTLKITNSRNAKTLSTSHMKQCIMSEQRFDFLRELVKNIPDISVAEEAANYNEDDIQSSPEEQYPDSDTPFDLSMPSTSTQATTRNIMRISNDDIFRSQSHNGRVLRASGSRNEQSSCRFRLQRDNDDPHRILNKTIICGVSSVIMHTANVTANNEPSPVKMLRSDSMPANTNPWSEKSSHTQQRRLKHQTYSLPNSNSVYQFSNTTHVNQASVVCGAVEQPLVPLSHLTNSTATILAPAVSFDFSNKPVVKIDYSNMPLSTEPAPTSLSGPVSFGSSSVDHLTSSDGVFDVNVAPTINIDLTNIVTSNNSSSASTPFSIYNNSASILSNILKDDNTIAINEHIENPHLELDEDYDNI